MKNIKNYKDKVLYIAGPECFYPRGYDYWWAQRKLAEYLGFTVALPTDTPLKLDAEDKRDNAHEIFDDLIVKVEESNTIIADLESFRGSEPDGGSVFEMGWIYSKGGTLYGWTRDMRSTLEKSQMARVSDGRVLDEKGFPYPYADLPFCPSIVGSTKLVEGNFENCLKAFQSDIDEEVRRSVFFVTKKREEEKVESDSKKVFISSWHRYGEDAEKWNAEIAEVLEKKGFEAVFPVSRIEGIKDPIAEAASILRENLRRISSADTFIGDLEGFRGTEPSADVSFECGWAYGMGKKLYAALPTLEKMRVNIPTDDSEHGVDWNGNTIENFDYPVNLMFSCVMDMRKGSVREVLEEVL